MSALVVAAIGLVLAGASIREAGSVGEFGPYNSDWANQSDGDTATRVERACDTALDSGSAERSTPIALPAAGLPEGSSLIELGSGSIDRFPEPPSIMQLTRIELAPGAGSETRISAGPVLFYVLSGYITAYLEGEPVELEPGASFLVPMERLYAFINVEGSPATLLRLAVAPRGRADVPVGDFLTPPPLLQTPPSGELITTLLFRSPAGTTPSPPARLLIACLQFTTGDGPALKVQLAGQLGLKVERGNPLVDGRFDLPESGCTVLSRRVPHTIDAAGGPSTVLLFGAIPDGADLWQLADAEQALAAAPPEDLNCGEA
jgi:quercetin dioxygenase-like cupin family protein